jgi:hypothetical protein
MRKITQKKLSRKKSQPLIKMSNIVVEDNFRSQNNNKKYVIKIEDPITRIIYLSKEVTVPTSGVYKLALSKVMNIPPETPNYLSEIEGLNLSKIQGRPRSSSLTGNNLGLHNAVGRPRSPSLSEIEGLNLSKIQGRPRSSSLTGNNLGLHNAVGRPRSPSLSGNNLELPKGGRKRKTRRQRK